MKTQLSNMASASTEKERVLFNKNSKNVRNQHTFQKRAPPKLSRRDTDFYISTKSNFKSQWEKCEKILDSNGGEIVLHGMGAAIDRTINLALQLQQKYLDTCVIDVNTSTVSLQDDFEPQTEDVDFESQTRQNSGIHIRVYRTNLPE